MTPRLKSLLSHHGKKLIMGLLFIIIISASCLTAYAATTKNITIDANGKTIQASTHGKTVADVLKENGITVKPHDAVTPSLSSLAKDGTSIKWLPAIQVEVNHYGKTENLWTTAKNVGDFLSQEGMTVAPHDTVSPSPDTPLTEDLIIQVKKGIQVTLNVGGKAQDVWTTSKSVQELLDQQNITLGSKDKVKPSLDSIVVEGSHILVTRVTTKKKVVKKSVDYKVINKNDSSLKKGQSRVLREGENGEQAKTYEVTYENGKEVKRDLIKTELIKSPTNKIVANGTKVVQRAVSTSRSLASSGKTIEMVSTAYSSDCKGCSGHTASGVSLHSGAKVIAVDPRVIPLGTKVYVEGYGYAVAGDTGGAIKGNRIDIYFSSHSEAKNWGYRRVQVRVLN
ncbi:ubiquitin-like domain-containing protein [Pullulanibacillus sp. KACC 23026]|uniref:ubiquitin-like domain-containing protein n=1 Tax=Pullulanibacillus sp. KACC 23026 TaxID=3028315 RepID=UPI0023B09356|nr:ubiquitin-like domain-containing protein [Pullulanibacillus sp. KACC 23026]WEG12742.1 ubiquitin-like domain-containing protein [Pullulanibacillus sp. KACC 23026]